MAQCDYWWFAGGVEWCDLQEGPCRCGGWEESCGFRAGKRNSMREPTPAHLRRDMSGKRLSKGARHSHFDSAE